MKGLAKNHNSSKLFCSVAAWLYTMSKTGRNPVEIQLIVITENAIITDPFKNHPPSWMKFFKVFL